MLNIKRSNPLFEYVGPDSLADEVILCGGHQNFFINRIENVSLLSEITDEAMCMYILAKYLFLRVSVKNFRKQSQRECFLTVWQWFSPIIKSLVYVYVWWNMFPSL